jgi:acetyl-CoA acetyltransferase
MYSTTLGWRMVNPRMDPQWTVSLGEGAEILADQYKISREAQDEFALGSHQRAAAAWDRGVFDGEVAPVPGADLDRDESIRPGTSMEALAKLKPAFRPDVNPNGGAIAIGHPLGCSGARILGALAHELHRSGGRWGLAAICIGVGQGLAVVLENAAPSQPSPAPASTGEGDPR